MSKGGRTKGKGLGHVPDFVVELAEQLGGNAAFKLLELYGGQVLYVPVQAASDHPMRAMLGDANFEALVKAFPGERMELPKNDALTRQHRHRLVLELLERGYKHNEIAARTNYTRRHVINVLNAAAVAVPQLDLFADQDPDRDLDYAVGLTVAHDPFGMRKR